MTTVRILDAWFFWVSLIGLGPMIATAEAADKTAHDFDFVPEGDPLPMRRFAGKAVLVVNTASFCGFTDQHKDLTRSGTTIGTGAWWCWAYLRAILATRNTATRRKPGNLYEPTTASIFQ